MNASRNTTRYQEPQPPKKKKFPWWTIPVILVCLCLLGGAWVLAENALAQYDAFNQKRAAVSANTFYGPVFIDDIPLSGMTWDEAREVLTAPKEAQAQSFRATLTTGDASWEITSDNVPMEWNTESLLEKAYMIGRSGSLEERYNEITTLTAPVQLYSEFTYDRDSIRPMINAIGLQLQREPVNAAVVAFDVANRSFGFSEEQPGQTLDVDALYRTVIEKLDSGEYGAVIPVNMVELPATVTRATLEREYTRISSYSTKTTSDKNRNVNIALAANALNGQMIQPGGTISFNETTGERTPEKGYLEAGAIENGRTIQEYGGGVCQVSSTLFNALARANCEIVTRKPHAWPSDYVPRGEDATVDWPRLDLVMRNTSEVPMFITAWYEDQRVTIEVYGLSLGEGKSIELESETTYSKTPTEVIYTYNANLPLGTNQLLKKPRTGYSVTTYKVWLENGVEVSREKFYTSEYRAINEEYEYNDGKPPA